MWLLGNVPVRRHKQFCKEARPFTTRIYVPMITVEKVVKKVSKPVKIKKPAFGQYIFLKVRNGMWAEIGELKDFRGWVEFDGSPETILPKHIRAIKQLEKLNFGNQMSKMANITMGDVMMINTELMQGMTGKVIDLLRHRRLVLLVNGRPITLDIDSVSAIR